MLRYTGIPMLRSLVLLVLLLLAPPALADECTSPVFDSTGKANASEIEPLLKKIVGDGADPALVRILTTDQMNKYGNLDKYAGAMLNRCPSWQSAGGRLKSNIFLLILEPNGKVAVQFAKKGPFQNILTHEKIVDIGQEMGGLISKGDLTGAAKAGLIRSHDLISAPAPKVAAPIVASGPVTIVNHNEKPADLSGLWTFMKWLLALGVLAGLGFAAYLYLSSKSKRQAAQQKAQVARGACTNLIEGFAQNSSIFKVLLAPVKPTISATEYAALLSRIEAWEGTADRAKNQFASQSGSANDPESSGLSVNSYDAMTETFERLQSNLERISSEATQIEKTIRGIGLLRDSAQPAIDELGREIEAATRAINAETTLKTDGPRATLKRAIDAVEMAEEKLAEKSFQAVIDACRDGMSLARKATQELKGLATRKRDVENSISRLESNDPSNVLSRVDSIIETTRKNYGDSSVASASGHRSTISQKMTERRLAISSAKSALTLQDWNQAERQIEVAKKATQVINNAVESIEDLGPAVLRQRRAQEEEERRREEASRRAASRSSYRSQSQVTHVHHHHEDDSPGFGTGALLGGLAGLAVGSSLRDDEDRRDRGWGDSRSSDDDNDFGGSSVQTSRSDDSDSDFGGGSIDTSSNDDNGFSSNND